MAFQYGPYTFDAQADGDAAEFLWTGQNGSGNVLSNSNTAGDWCWEDASTTSSNVGPDNGAGGSPDGYAYTEMSSQTAGDIWYMTFDTVLDASANAIVFNFKWCARGDDADPNIQLQTNEDGAGWVDRGALMGHTVRTIPGTSGVTTWWSESIDLTGLISDANTQIRIEFAMDGATSWHHDVGVDEVEIVGTDLTTPGAGMQLASAQLLQVTAGAEDPGTFDFSKSLPWGGITIALRKAPATALELDFDSVDVPGTYRVSNANTGAPLTINKTGSGQLIASDPGTGDGQTNIIASNTFDFTVVPSITGYEWRLYEVLAIGSMDGAVELDGVESAASDSDSYTYNSVSDIIVALQIIAQPDEDYEESVTYYTLSNADQSVTVNLTKDENN